MRNVRGKHTRRERHPLYYTWSGLKQRCLNTRHRDFHRYGGRGVSVCDRWRDSFEAFVEDVGEKPGPDFSLDRVDNNGDYEPGNTRWATRAEQNANKRRGAARGEKARSAKLTEDAVREVRKLLAQGVKQTEVAKQLGVAKQTVSNVKNGVTWGWLV